MLKYEHDFEKGKYFLEVSGTGVDICSDVTLLVEQVYCNIKNQDEDLAENFRLVFKSAISNDLPFLNSEGKAELLQNKKKEQSDAKKRILDILEEILCS